MLLVPGLNEEQKDRPTKKGGALKGKNIIRVAFCGRMFLPFCFALFVIQLTYSQQPSAQTDSAQIYQPILAQHPPPQKDTSEVYGNIETYSKKNKFTTFLYSLVFRPVAVIYLRKRPPALLQPPYSYFEGKIIRNINILSLDPFGYSVRDSLVLPKNFVFKTGNVLHVKTQQFTIKNILLFHKNERFDTLLFKESKRLVRSQAYIREAFFDVVPVDSTSDSVDMHIRVLDKWSFIPDGAFSTARVTLGFSENNVAGFGHEFQNAYTWNHSDGTNDFFTNYTVRNILNSYISAAIHYDRDENKNYGTWLTIDRPFYSPLARWAAGVKIAQEFRKDTVADTVPGQARQDITMNTQDYWAGFAKKVFKGNTEDERTTKAIFAARYLLVRYPEKPDELHDPLHSFSDEDLYLSSIGISKLKYLQDNYIFNFGVIEDVPVGGVFGITGGYQKKDVADRLYLGARVSFGDYHKWGYVSSTFEYGTFFHGTSLQQGVFSARANYFSNLLKIGSWQVRQFIKPQVTWGTNRFPYDSLTINNENGIRGFNGSLGGTRKVVLTFQTQSYAPWHAAGFRFGPFLNCSLGMLGNATSGFKSSQVYSQLGIGALINNEYLVFTNFQLSIAYYPSIPENGYNIFKVNAFITTDIGFGDFKFEKPEIAAFR
jgi:hypothetical protein